MKKIFLHTIMVALSLLGTLSINAEERTFTVDGIERYYQIFYPKEYSVTNETPYDLLLIMHPNGFTVEDFVSISNPQAISDINNVIVVYPQALDEQNEEIQKLFSTLLLAGIDVPGFATTAVWNSGASVSTDFLKELAGNYGAMLSLLIPNTMSKGKMVFNENVDDVKFIDELVNALVANENANKDGLYMVGASMGGAMTYRYAFSGGNPVKGIAVVNGFVGKEIAIPEKITFPICVFHSVADSTVKYNGGPINEGIETIVQTFVKSSGFSGESKVMPIEDIAADGNTIEKTIYDDGTHPKIHLFKSDNATHADIFVSDYVSGPNDIDHIFECGRFFWGDKFGLDVEDIESEQVIALSPNPALDYINVSEIGEYEIFTSQGALILKGICDGTPICVSSLLSGNYVVKVITAKGVKVGKLIKK